MTLQERLEILQEQYKIMLDYRQLCNGINCSINYSSLDFDREGELLKKINETKDWINEKK
jgi:hypothetical protein